MEWPSATSWLIKWAAKKLLAPVRRVEGIVEDRTEEPELLRTGEDVNRRHFIDFALSPMPAAAEVSVRLFDLLSAKLTICYKR